MREFIEATHAIFHGLAAEFGGLSGTLGQFGGDIGILFNIGSRGRHLRGRSCDHVGFILLRAHTDREVAAGIPSGVGDRH